MLALDPQTRLTLSPTILLRSLPDQDWYFAFDVDSGDQFQLNRTSFWILETIGTGVVWGDLRARFVEAFDVSPEEAEADLLAVIDQCQGEKIVRRLSNGEQAE